MDGLRKVLKDIATMHGRMSTNLTVTQSLAESPEWETMKKILRAVCDEVPEAQPVLLKHMRHHVLSVTKEEVGAMKSPHSDFLGWDHYAKLRAERLKAANSAGHPEWVKLPASRREAKGEGKYFTGKPCKSGHISHDIDGLLLRLSDGR